VSGVSALSRTDPVVRAASEVVGGPAGRRLASRTGFWGAIPVLVILSVVLMGFGVLQKQHCRSEGWGSPDEFYHACYSDLPAWYSTSRPGNNAPDPSARTVIGTSLGLPPLTGTVIWATSKLISTDSSDSGRRFFDLCALLSAGFLTVAVGAVALARRRRWDAAHLALSPLLITSALVSFELFAVMLLALAMLAWSRRRLVSAGVLLGLATAARPLYGVVAVAILVLALRPDRDTPEQDAMPDGQEAPDPAEALSGPAGLRLARAGLIAAVTAVVWALVRWAVYPGLFSELRSVWTTWRQTGPGYGSLWMLPHVLGEQPGAGHHWWTGEVSSAQTTTVCLVAFAVTVAVAVYFALSPDHRLTVPQVALVLVVGTMLSSKALPVQASVLLLPLVALCGLRWRDHLIWAGAELLYFVGVWMYIAWHTHADRGLPPIFYAIFVLLRVGALIWLASQAVAAGAIRRDVDPLAPGPGDPTAQEGEPQDEGEPRDDVEQGSDVTVGENGSPAPVPA